MELFVTRKADSLIPDGVDSAAEFARIPFGKVLKCEVRQPRSIQHHRLYFALAHRIANATGMTVNVVDHLLRIAAGHCDIVRTKKYGDLRLPKPLKFSACDQLEFKAFFEGAVRAAYEEFGIENEVFNDLLVQTEQTR